LLCIVIVKQFSGSRGMRTAYSTQPSTSKSTVLWQARNMLKCLVRIKCQICYKITMFVTQSVSHVDLINVLCHDNIANNLDRSWDKLQKIYVDHKRKIGHNDRVFSACQLHSISLFNFVCFLQDSTMEYFTSWVRTL